MSKLPVGEWDSFMDWMIDLEYNKLGLPKPTITIFLKLPVEVAQQFLSNRYDGDNTKKDLHEADIEYMHRCMDAALYAAKKLNWRVIDCMLDKRRVKSVHQTHNDVLALIQNLTSK